MAQADRTPSTTPGSLDDVARTIRAMLSRTPAATDDKVELLAGAMVVEAFQPHWRTGRTAAEAYAALRRSDPELADTIDAIAPMLLARLECHEESASAVAAVEELLKQ